VIPSPTADGPQQCDVLVVDDDITLSDLIGDFLARSGFRVRTAHSGTSAMRVVDVVEPQVTVLDYQLPDTTGVELACALRGRLPGLRVILMSGNAPPLDRKTLEQAGVMVSVDKPMPLGPLRDAVRRLLRS
jgi:DNA-binding response OmpR family regulator